MPPLVFFYQKSIPLFPGRAFLFSALLLALVIAFPAHARGKGMCLTPDDQLAYARHCLDEKEYEAAASAYKAFLYFFPNDPRANEADYQIALCLFHQKDHGAALNRFTALLDRVGPENLGLEAAWMISRCYQKMGDTPSAIAHLGHLARLSQDPEVRDRAFHEMGWLYLGACDFAAARAAFDRVGPAGRERFHLAAVDNALGEAERIPQKSPVTAGLLSLAPGGGYLYCGRYRDALVAFVVNAACMMAATESFDQDLPAVGGIFTALGLGFYSGSIHGGITSARKYNNARKKEVVRQLREEMGVDVSAGGAGKRAWVRLAWRF